VRRVRDKLKTQEFYIGSLKSELQIVCQGNLSMILHFQNMQNYNLWLLNHTRITTRIKLPLQTWKTTRNNPKTWERSNLSSGTTWPTKPLPPKFKNQVKSSKNDSRSIFNNYASVWSQNREYFTYFRMFSRSKW